MCSVGSLIEPIVFFVSYNIYYELSDLFLDVIESISKAEFPKNFVWQHFFSYFCRSMEKLTKLYTEYTGSKPANIQKIAFTVTIYDAEGRHQNFGQVSNSFIRLVDESNNIEMIRYDLGEDFSIETAVVVGEIYRHNGEWKFNAIGSGFQGGLAALCGHYGIEVA